MKCPPEVPLHFLAFQNVGNIKSKVVSTEKTSETFQIKPSKNAKIFVTENQNVKHLSMVWRMAGRIKNDSIPETAIYKVEIILLGVTVSIGTLIYTLGKQVMNLV